MSKNREKTNKKVEKKHTVYDNIAVSERALSILIVFGIIAAALAITCGYFMGNGSGRSIPPIAKTCKNRIYAFSFAQADGYKVTEKEINNSRRGDPRRLLFIWFHDGRIL